MINSLSQNTQNASHNISSKVLIRMGDIFEGGYDLTVLPCSAKGTIRPGVRKHAAAYGIPLPTPMEHGGLGKLLKFRGSQHVTKFVVYAASVLNDFSSTDIIQKIGTRIGELTNTHTEIHTVEAPLLGTGAGRLNALDAAQALKKGFEFTQSEAILTIFVLDYQRYKLIENVFSKNTF